MKKIITLITILFITLITTTTVYAANYEIKELIPVGTETTIVTKYFSYRQFYYEKTDNKIHFQSIKNISDTEMPVSISIGLFGKNKKNIGVLHYCDVNSKLGSNVEIPFSIEVTSEYLGEKFTKEDIKYIAVLEDNHTCKTDKSQNYIGQKAEDIGNFHGGELSDSTKLTIQVISIVAGVILVIFLYQFLFTNKFKNFDGNEVREVLKNYKNDTARANTFGKDSHSELPDGLTLINRSKTTEMADKEAEENEKSKRKENDLYDMYK